jgi:cobalt-zinc-cadmium efflux system membrane fusion protein
MKACFIVLMLLASQLATAAGPVVLTETQRKALQIETGPAVATTRNLGSLLPARVAVPNAQLQVVTAPQEGLIEVLLSAEGETVTAGQPLVRIQSPRLLELQSEYLEIYTRQRLASTNYRRDRQLSEEGIIADRRLLESRANYQELTTSLARVRRLLELAGMDEAELAALGTERELNSTLLVRAPFDGVILEQLVTAGSRVEAADPIYHIAQLDPLWLEIHVPLGELGETRVGQQVVVPELEVTGRIITIGHMVHGADQGVLIRAEVHEGSDRLRPGQFVQTRLAMAAPANSYQVPRSAVVYSTGESYVFVEQPEGFVAVAVTVTEEDAGKLVISAELPANARIATSGAAAIKSAWLQGDE